jgi:cytochrome c oxidase subunit II
MSSENSYEKKHEEIDAEVEPILHHTGPFHKKAAAKILVIWAIFTVIGVLAGLYLPSRLFPALFGPEMHDVWLTFVVFTVAAAPVAALVYAVAFYSLIAWREKGFGKSDTPPPDAESMHGNSLVSSIWIGASVVLVLFLLVWGMAELSAETAPQKNAIVVNVTGQQWLWTFSYPGTGVTTHTLIVPEGRQVDFHVTSMDVTHGFWPVQLGVQMDANPNVTTYISATPNKVGTFAVRCSQLCGLYHAYMQTTGKVVTNQQFASWLSSQGASQSAVQGYALGGK